MVRYVVRCVVLHDHDGLSRTKTKPIDFVPPFDNDLPTYHDSVPTVGTHGSTLNCNSQTENMRDHLIDKHWNLYSSRVLANGLKGWEKIASGVISGPDGQKAAVGDREPFSVEGFYECLIKWMTRYVDCPLLHCQILTNTFVQSINVIDSPELHNLLTFISSELTDADIPHHFTYKTHHPKLPRGI